MTREDWVHIKRFTPSENWGDPLKMNFGLLWLLDSFRENINSKITVVCGTQGVHAKHSQHYTGKAVDIVTDADGKSKIDLIFLAMKFPFTGLGVYPMARESTMKDPIGFHFDCRDVADLPRGVTQATWIGIPAGEPKLNKMEYFAINEENLKRFKIL